MKRYLVTGATGFIGRLLCAHLLDENWGVRGTIQVSKDQTTLIPGVEPAVIEPIDSGTQWRNALAGIDTIIHLAARVHIMNHISSDPLIEFRRVNTEGTKRLANEAVRTGVKRMVFVSSIKVNGEEASEPYNQNSPPNPSGPYSISLEVVVVRPTLVYGPGVKANFLHMMKIIQRGIPLPLASITNKRSLIYSGNFVNALTICAVHPAAAGKTYLVSDGEDVSTPDLIRRVANALGKPARLVRMSPKLLRLAGILTGRSAEVSRITGSLTVDSSNIRRELDWKQPFTMEEGLHETADWFKKNLSI
jgi:nucleoside-diphosphate-sugar epimerase